MGVLQELEFMETLIFDRSQLMSGQVIYGPSVIEEFGSTTVIFPGQEATIDNQGIIVIRRINSKIKEN